MHTRYEEVNLMLKDDIKVLDENILDFLTFLCTDEVIL